jgi:hypothetical protein
MTTQQLNEIRERSRKSDGLMTLQAVELHGRLIDEIERLQTRELGLLRGIHEHCACATCVYSGGLVCKRNVAEPKTEICGEKHESWQFDFERFGGDNHDYKTT